MGVIKIYNEESNLAQEPISAYELAENALLKQALQRTHMERFLFATKLYKIQKTIEKAKITHQPNFKK
jgi:hypothetical protein